MTEEYDQAIDQAVAEFKRLYTTDMKFVKPSAVKAELVKAVSMRAKDIYREGQQPLKKFKFDIRAYNLDRSLWDACPGCKDVEITHKSDNGHEWQGCYKCDILLGSNGIIQSMDHSKGRKNGKGEVFGHRVEEKS